MGTTISYSKKYLCCIKFKWVEKGEKMKKISWFLFLALSVLLVGCSSVKTPKASLADHDEDHNIPAIDRMIISMKKEYIQKCYMPVAKREPPENACQTELFQLLERRYHSDYSQDHVDMASNDLFFKDIDAEITKMVRSDPEVRSALRNGAFRSTEEMKTYYKSKYMFSHN